MLNELRVRAGDEPGLAARKPGGAPEAPGDAEATHAALVPVLEELAVLQERLYAERRRSVLVVLQGADCAGKDGTVRHVIRGLNPAGVRVVSFKEPTSDELAHDFLWRVHRACPPAGDIAIFNRSHYEDVTTVRVKGLVAEPVWRERFEEINSFERLLLQSGTRIVKLYLHISVEEQADRIRARAADPAKQWKLTAADIEGHHQFAQCQAAWEEAIARTSTDRSPWWVVPANHKWYRDWAVAQILLRTLSDMDPKPPKVDLPVGLDSL